MGTGLGDCGFEGSAYERGDECREGRNRMRRTWGRAVRTAGLAVIAGVVVTGCAAQSSIVPAHVDTPVVVIETASFGEAEIVGHIYGNALTRQGWRVEPRPQSGTQAEAVEAVTTGEATFTVGFTGELLTMFDPGSQAVAAEDVYPAEIGRASCRERV